jgi:hypothetical protein
MLRQLREKCPFGLIVPIGLFNRASRAADRIECAARRIRSNQMCRQIPLLKNLNRLEVGGPDISRIFQNQRPCPIADHNPLSVPD